MTTADELRASLHRRGLPLPGDPYRPGPRLRERLAEADRTHRNQGAICEGCGKKMDTTNKSGRYRCKVCRSELRRLGAPL